MATKDDIVQLAGVSRSSVFRFFKGERVRPEAKEKILSAIQQLKYPYEPAPVSGGKTLAISIRPDFEYFKGYGLSIMGFMNRATSLGYKVELRTGTPDSKDFWLHNPEAYAGVLILGKTTKEEELEAKKLQEHHIPCVLVNRVYADFTHNWVSVDLETAAKEATLYLIDLGYHNIGTWGALSNYQIDVHKRKGYLAAFKERKLPAPTCCFNDTDGEFEDIINTLIQENRLPPAWFASTDEIAMRLSKVVREQGMCIPEDISIIGMDDVDPAAFMNPPLTSIHIPYQEAGMRAMDLLTYLIDNPEVGSGHIVLKHRLIERESCIPNK